MANKSPKKLSLGRKPNAETPNDYYRCCKMLLKVCYSYSWKSLFFPLNSQHVLVLWQTGKTDVRVTDIDQKENITLLKKIALINWTAVANAVLTHSELRQGTRPICRYQTEEAGERLAQHLVSWNLGTIWISLSPPVTYVASYPNI